ncbi:LysR family transcriptional regulator [Sphingomicrobium sediminis]|uniref:LysR family transcriptional regulator n=1 Tax=Sphingomicrobium sediminis TaxID=2950949 RepID=A0A9X2J3X8_9SPHN|nr:LysR family transcriptional regulator [Sphingomicrobium sediminis]MCM8556662.1 LysR family transcriptional regulator [Sphingomicrobium sediminis]
MKSSLLAADWNHVRAFLATAEEGSFSAAARVLNSTQPTIGRQIAALEQDLGITLVERSGRGLMLTSAGEQLLDHVRAMGHAVTKISMIADGHAEEIVGTVTITATDLMAAAVLPEILRPLRETAPKLRILIDSANDTRDLMRREADIAIRHGRPDQPELIAKLIGQIGARLYASSNYLDRVGRPKTVADIAKLDFIGLPDPNRLLPSLEAMGIRMREENFVVSPQSATVVWEMVKAGYGMGMLPDTLCQKTPGIEQVFPGLPSLQVPAWLVTHRELRTSRKIRMVYDCLYDGLKRVLGSQPK